VRGKGEALAQVMMFFICNLSDNKTRHDHDYCQQRGELFVSVAGYPFGTLTSLRGPYREILRA